MVNKLSNNEVVWAFRADGNILNVQIGEHVVIEITAWRSKYFVEFHNVTRIRFDDDTYSDTIGDSEVEEKGSQRNLQVFDLEMALIFDIDYEFCILTEGSDKL